MVDEGRKKREEAKGEKWSYTATWFESSSVRDLLALTAIFTTRPGLP
jgi:hypothetical protein